MGQAERIRTNPVLCFDNWLDIHFRSDNPPASRRIAAKKLHEWIEAGVEFPPSAIDSYRDRGFLPVDFEVRVRRPPRVVGLVFDKHEQIGLVDPLTTRRATDATHSPLLPFNPLFVQSLLIRLCEELAPIIPGALPEILDFDFRESLQEPINGSSMDIAGLISALDALADEHCEMFAACCAVVEPRPDGSLNPVGHLKEKLDAFLREFGRGSLLVVSPVTTLEPRVETAFDVTWRVSSIPELAQKIGEIPRLVSRLIQQGPIHPKQVGLVLSRLRFLEEERNFAAVIRLCERVAQNDFDGTVPACDKARVKKYHYDSLRHLGQYLESLTVMKQAEPLDVAVSWDEELEFAVAEAAALIDSCDFDRARAQLESWSAICDKEPRRFSIPHRIELFNTLGRCLTTLGDDRFEHLFKESIRLQKQFDPASIRRTECYLVHAFLRVDRHADAHMLIEKHEASPMGDNLADGFTRFYRCELERRQGNVWPASEKELPRDWVGYTRAFALQAMGRQRGRETSQAAELLEHAVELLKSETDDDDHNILTLIARALMLHWAWFARDTELWNEAAGWIHQRVCELGNAQQSWFADALDALGHEPEWGSAEGLIQRMPYL